MRQWFRTGTFKTLLRKPKKTNEVGFCTTTHTLLTMYGPKRSTYFLLKTIIEQETHTQHNYTCGI